MDTQKTWQSNVCGESLYQIALTRDLIREVDSSMALAILRPPKGWLKPSEVAMWPLDTGSSLAARIGEQSLFFFEALGLGLGFLMNQ